MNDAAELLARIDNDRYMIEGYSECEKCGYSYPIISEHRSPLEGRREILSDKCPKCLVNEEDDRFRYEAKQELKRRELKKFNQFTVIPHDLEDKTFQSYVSSNDSQQNAKETVELFVNDELEKTTLFFQGDTGLGKSHLSYCAYKKFNDDLKTAIFIDLPSLMNMIKSTFGSNTKHMTSQDEILDHISKVDLLVLDDIGAEYVKPDANGFESWAADILFQIANARQGKKNIYTTNFTSKYLNKKYGMMSKRIISRLMSNAKIIKVEGDDYRLKGLE